MSARILLVRHGQTDWNRQKRIQGHSDVPLCQAGIELLRGRVPAEPWRLGPCFSSPLQRARETARLLGAAVPVEVAALREMSWGSWEGETLAALRARLGEEMSRNEARGQDFRPAGGESPRDVMRRLNGWLMRLPPGTVGWAVTHKGVIRAALALATGWDMRAPSREKLDYAAGHAFRIANGRLMVEKLNIALELDSGDGSAPDA